MTKTGSQCAGQMPVTLPEYIGGANAEQIGEELRPGH